MNEMPPELQNLIDDYLEDALDEARLQELESLLRSSAEARGHFALYCRLHTDLHMEVRARQAGRKALNNLGELLPTTQGHNWLLVRGWLLAAAATLLAAAGFWWWVSARQPVAGEPLHEEIAWITNAQDCQWIDNKAPAGDMAAGKLLQLQRGLVEVRFQAGAHVVLEGPAELQLLTRNSARLIQGKLSAKVPASAKGFQIMSPQGKVVDLGTEFAMAVAQNGTTDVYVFHGKVEAHASAPNSPSPQVVNVQEKQAARIDASGVALQSPHPYAQTQNFVRAIVPAPKIVPRTFALDFKQGVPKTLLDSTGAATGLTHRLPGTGKKLLKQDENLHLDPGNGQLILKTTKSDINTSYRLDWGEYLGFRLAELGFTGKEDFAVTVVVPDIPELRRVGQFGLYAGLNSKRNIRGGMISTKEPSQYRQFMVLNRDGKDAAPHQVGVGFAGDDLRLTLRREGKQFSLTVENLETESSTGLKMLQPQFLENAQDLYVGFFGANTQSNEQRILRLKEFKVTVFAVEAP